MQKKKDELKQDIYAAACYEFLHKGYEAASMRTIAKRANTSIGNIYHYYDNKAALLDEIMENAIQSLDQLVEEHLSQKIRIISYEELNDVLENDEAFWKSGFINVLKSEVVIFLKQEEPRWQGKKQQFLTILKEHMAWHLGNVEASDGFIKIITNMFVESIVFVVKTNAKKELALADFRRLFRMICSGVIHKDDI